MLTVAASNDSDEFLEFLCLCSKKRQQETLMGGLFVATFFVYAVDVVKYNYQKMVGLKGFRNKVLLSSTIYC